ncbi:hypothetical protein [Rhodovulum euryhalinum]|uniref:Uncharacterized protein n=1 Tax=Rhodovulum euryhalinum TaxID=35805 RepID=A0A4R2KGB3_9RHOB|nr:hypothetical protein [Rhodovulum euryhalinum]TCO69008.1 hypothetical protein EV655_1194 [Rhodovulum euryhalinum]
MSTTLENVVLSGALKPQDGHRESPTEDQATSDLEIRGGVPAPRDRGHHDYGQTIQHNAERRSDLRTLRYQVNDGAIRPSDYSRYMIRTTGDLTVSLGRTIEVPADQRHPELGARVREADVEVIIYHASDANISWPSNVVWGRVGYTLTPDNPATADTDETALAEVAGPPPNPRAAGTADRFTLRYNERTAEWWAIATHTGVASADPDDAADDATDPEPDPEDPGEDGTAEPGDTEHIYFDPETGEPMATVQPGGWSGDLLAVHPGAVSVSDDCGATWTKYNDAPGSPLSVSAQRSSTVIASGGKAYRSVNYQDWTPLQLESEFTAEVPLVNGDFETGGLDGWTLVAGDEPRVLDTSQPPQRPGSSHYLSRDWVVFTDGEFELEQNVVIPSNGVVQLSADLFAEPGAIATVELLGRSTLPVIHGSPQFSGGVAAGFATAPTGETLDLHHTGGSLAGVAGGVNGGDGTRTFEVRYAETSEIYNRPIALYFGDIDDHEMVEVDTADILGYDFGDSQYLSANIVGSKTRFTSSRDNEGPLAIIFRNGNISFYLDLILSVVGLGGTPPQFEGLSAESTIISASNAGSGDWLNVVKSAPAESGEAVIRIRGEGSPANVYFDNIRLSLVSQRDETATAVARDLDGRRHIIATNTSLHMQDSGLPEYLAPVPFPSAFLAAAHGDTILLSDGVKVAISDDDGQTWATHVPAAGVSQLFAAPRPLAVLSSGAVVSVETDALTVLSTRAAGAWVAWDARRQRWVAVEPGGAVSQSPDLEIWSDPGVFPSQPSDTVAGERRILATDIGRYIGWLDEVRDLFHADRPIDQWSLSPSLTAPILHLVEIK